MSWPFSFWSTVLLSGFVFAVIGAPFTIAQGEDVKPSSFEPGEEFPGGRATTTKSRDHRDVFSQASRRMGFAKEADFKIGNAIFRKVWVSSPASTKSSDGLGPLFNARACQNCHFKDGRGHPPNGNWPEDDAISMFLRLSIPPQTEAQKKAIAEGRLSVVPEPTYGTQLQDFAIQGHDAEGRMEITYEDLPVRLADGTVVTLRKPTYKAADLNYGDLHPDTMLSPRVAPQMIGLGLLEAIPEADIRAGADPHDQDGDGISGRVREIWSPADKRLTVGRFGWKAGAIDVAQQSAGAFLGDMGLSTRMFPHGSGECTKAQTHCLAAPNGASPDGEAEVRSELFDLVVFYAQNLAVPKRTDAKDPLVLKGKALFAKLRCTSCHRPKFTTGALAGQKHLSHQTIWPYTDLLLHDMGAGLADNRPEGIATGREWKTPPLWGIGLTKVVSGHTFFLHDGRARNLEEAILWHGGEAQISRDGYIALPKNDRLALIAFLKSL